MIYTSKDMRYIARHVSRQEILRKIASEAESLAKAAMELCNDPESMEAFRALNDTASMLSGTIDILDVKGGYSPAMLEISRTSPFYINDWAKRLKEAEKHD